MCCLQLFSASIKNIQAKWLWLLVPFRSNFLARATCKTYVVQHAALSEDKLFLYIESVITAFAERCCNLTKHCSLGCIHFQRNSMTYFATCPRFWNNPPFGCERFTGYYQRADASVRTQNVTCRYEVFYLKEDAGPVHPKNGLGFYRAITDFYICWNADKYLGHRRW